MPTNALITNVTTSAILPTEGYWTLSGLFPIDVDEIVIRQILYSSTDLGRWIYLIRSDINNQVLGSVMNMEEFISCPETIIRLKGPLQSVITFQLSRIAGAALITAGDQISISMDFIKYQKH